MITKPRNVCLDNNTLYWSPVPYADGYNIHGHAPDGRRYVATVVGKYRTSYAIEAGLTGPYSVSAWVKDRDNRDAHTARSDPAGAPFAPSVVPAYSADFSDRERWATRYPYWDRDVIINNELQTYQEANVVTTASGRAAILSARKTDAGWTSGMLSGNVDESRQYGYFEADIDIENQQGFLPAFWLLNQNYVSQYHTGINPEIDIVEVTEGRFHNTYHAIYPRHNVWTSYVPYRSGVNRFGMLWEYNKLSWYLNGRVTKTVYGDMSPQEHMYPIFTLAVGGNWPGDPDPAVVKSDMIIEGYREWDLEQLDI